MEKFLIFFKYVTHGIWHSCSLALALMETLNDYGVADFELALTVGVFQYISVNDIPSAYLLSMIILMLCWFFT